jgi:hypothetical protein
MQHIEIPRDSWLRELDGFSKRHEKQVVRVDVTDESGWQHTEVCDLPLYGVSLDSHDARAVAILTMPADCCEHTTHEVLHPVAIQLDRTDSGAESGLSIRANDGSETRVAFRSPGQEEAGRGVEK